MAIISACDRIMNNFTQLTKAMRTIKRIFLFVTAHHIDPYCILRPFVAQFRMPIISACDHKVKNCTQPTESVQMIKVVFLLLLLTAQILIASRGHVLLNLACQLSLHMTAQ